MTRLAQLAGLSVALVIAVTPRAQAFEVSVEDYAEMCAGGDRTDVALEQAQALGATMVRLRGDHLRDGCQWRYATQAARGRGLKVHMTLVGLTRAHVAETVLAVRDQVNLYSAYNEPNISLFWKGPITSKTRSYVRYYRWVRRIVKRLDPAARVLWGEYAPDGGKHLLHSLRWMRRVRTDGIAVHPYVVGKNPPRLFRQRIRAFRKAARKAAKRKALCAARRPGCRPARVFVTEMGPHWWGGKQDVVPFWKVACRLRLPMMSQYMLRHQPAQDWDTSLFDRAFNPTGHAVALQSYLARSRCTRRRATAAFRTFNDLPRGEQRPRRRESPRAGFVPAPDGPPAEEPAPPSVDSYTRELMEMAE